MPPGQLKFLYILDNVPAKEELCFINNCSKDLGCGIYLDNNYLGRK